MHICVNFKFDINKVENEAHQWKLNQKFDIVLTCYRYCYYADLMQTVNTFYKDMMIKIYNKNLKTKFCSFGFTIFIL